jgi:formylglycine-generating enzyme required for sulfatase activity
MVWDSSWSTQNVAWDVPPDAGQCNGPNGIGSTLFYKDSDLPMNCVSWPQALAYCWWKEQARLPTDTEWRVVATSEGRQRTYPWGTQAPDCTNAIFDGPTHWCGFPVPVMTASAQTADKVFDIVGSVSEWLWDVSPQGDEYVYPADAGTDYPGPPTYQNPGRQWIGGAYWQHEDALSPIQPGATFSEPAETFDDQGWRCAKSLP